MLGITMLTEIFYGKYSMHVLLSLNFRGVQKHQGKYSTGRGKITSHPSIKRKTKIIVLKIFNTYIGGMRPFEEGPFNSSINSLLATCIGFFIPAISIFNKRLLHVQCISEYTLCKSEKSF